MKRKPVKIALGVGFAMALCDDGSLWVLENGKWTPIPPIPDSEPGGSSLGDWEAGQ